MSNNYITTNYKDKLNETNYNNDNIYLAIQFYIPSDKKRYEEIKYCLKRNIELNKFNKIFLLNERLYTQAELDLHDHHMQYIEQIVIKSRFKYIDVFKTVKKINLKGYIVIANADIFFDNTIINVRKSCLSINKSFYALIRFEYRDNYNLNECKLFTINGTDIYHPGSQDTWIYHTNFINDINIDIIKAGIYTLGVPGCDSKIAYSLNELGYKVINEPYNIRTYHYHTSNFRNYTLKDQLPLPYLYLEPIIR